jgi:putative addiction module component (TIGR02574 family)
VPHHEQAARDRLALSGRRRQRILGRMSLPVEKIAELALALSSDARALLADRLVESLDPLADDDIRAAWIDESRARLDALRSGEVQAIPRDEALARIRTRLK